MDYLNILQDASLLANASASEKLIGCLIVTVLGMGITFVALLVLWVSIIVMSKLLNPKKKEEVIKVAPQEPVKMTHEADEVEEENAEELIAVIAAAVAASLNTSIHNIVVRNVVRVSDSSPAWNSAGRQEQMNTRFQ